MAARLGLGTPSLVFLEVLVPGEVLVKALGTLGLVWEISWLIWDTIWLI